MKRPYAIFNHLYSFILHSLCMTQPCQTIKIIVIIEKSGYFWHFILLQTCFCLLISIVFMKTRWFEVSYVYEYAFLICNIILSEFIFCLCILKLNGYNATVSSDSNTQGPLEKKTEGTSEKKTPRSATFPNGFEVRMYL